MIVCPFLIAPLVIFVSSLVFVIVLLIVVVLTVVIIVVIVFQVLWALCVLLARTAVEFMRLLVVVLCSVDVNLVLSHVAQCQIFTLPILFVALILWTVDLRLLLHVCRVFSTLLLCIHLFLYDLFWNRLFQH
jgi:hypothetical protein